MRTISFFPFFVDHFFLIISGYVSPVTGGAGRGGGVLTTDLDVILSRLLVLRELARERIRQAEGGGSLAALLRLARLRSRLLLGPHYKVNCTTIIYLPMITDTNIRYSFPHSAIIF